MDNHTQTPSTKLPPARLPLQGLLVVALEQAVAAPLCTARLRQAGARVIKIEREAGDFARNYDRAAAGESSYFTWINQGKESIVLDLKDPNHLQQLAILLSHADVFVQNLAPGATRRMGFDQPALAELNSSLITCNISGYGNDEAVSHLKAYDLLVQAEAGLISVSGGPDAPGRIGISLCDIGAGVTAHAAILEALIQRGITDRGDNIDISLFDVAAEWMTVPYIHARYGSGAPSRQGLHHPSIAPYGAYRSGDGVETLISIQNEREWQRLCSEVLEAPELADDSRFCSNELRIQNRPALDDVLTGIISQWDAATFRQRLASGKIAFGGINSVVELQQHAALRVMHTGNSAGDSIELPAHPFSKRMDENTRTPTVGEHTAAIQLEFSLLP